MTRSRLAWYVRAKLKRARVCFVEVDESKRALFSASRLAAFDFVVYSDGDGPHLLVQCDQDRQSAQDLREWGLIFGEGFLPVVADWGGKRYGDPIELRTTDGEFYRPQWVRFDVRQTPPMTPEARGIAPAPTAPRPATAAPLVLTPNTYQQQELFA
mgnify:CR=1 FL=1